MPKRKIVKKKKTSVRAKPTKKEAKPTKRKRGCLTVIGGPMFAGKTTRLLTIFSVLRNLGYSVLCFKVEAYANGGMGHTNSHDERSLPVLYVDLKTPTRILQYTEMDNIQKVVIDAIHFFPKNQFITVVNKLLGRGVDVYVNGLIFDYRKKEYGCTKSLMKMADEKIELYSTCTRCAAKARHTERISGGTEQSIGTTGKKKAIYIPVCTTCHRMYTG